MLDIFVRPAVQPFVEKISQSLIQKKISATQIAFIGFLLGLTGIFAVGLGAYIAGLAFLLFNRLFDGIHMAMERAGQTSVFGNYFMVAARWFIDSGFVFFFALSLPMQAMGAAFVLFTYVALKAVTYDSEADEARAPYAMSRIVESTEIMIFMALCCLFPHAFSAIAVLFGTLCIVTIFGRLWEAGKILR